MAHIEININEFETLLGRQITDAELDEASFLGAHWNHVEDEKWDVEIYPNRPDLLSVEGLSRAYRGFFRKETGLKEYEISSSGVGVDVDESVKEVRPYIGGAVVRGLKLDERAINGLIQLQEKLHETMGRKRDKLAIGLHDMSSLEPPFTYRAAEPGEVSFTPLESEEEMDLGRILDEHEKGIEYSWILEEHERYPIIVDSDGNVLSFPPIINNQLTEVGEGTEDIFVDVTGKDLETVRKALNIIVTALAERGGQIETVTVDGDKMPDLEPDEWSLDTEYVRDVSGLELESSGIAQRLRMMGMGADPDVDNVEVKVPAYRTDVMHEYDLIEDIVIAHRYTNVEPQLPDVDQIADQEPVSDFKDLLRDIMLGAGALEAHTYILSSPEKLFDRMEMDRQPVVKMSNALTEEYSAVRDRLLPSLMEVLKMNRQHSYPQSFFEAARVTELADTSSGASDSDRLCYVTAGPDVDYTDAREVLQVLERELGAELEVESSGKNFYIDGRSGELKIDEEVVGHVGELSEAVLENWELSEITVAAFELDVEKLMSFSR